MSDIVSNSMILLAGDVGGTKTVLGLFNRGTQTPITEMTFLNKEYQGLSPIIDKFLSKSNLQPNAACFAIAGPVMGNMVQMTNIKWIINGDKLCDEFALKQVFLINDLMATAKGAIQLPGEELLPIQKGKEESTGNIAVIAPGTGLGEAFLVQTERGLIPCATEGGHSGFAPGDDVQLELLSQLQKKKTFISVEAMCSGSAIGRLYDFFLNRTTENNGERLNFSGPDRTPEIVKAALQSLQPGAVKCEPAMLAIQLLVDILAGEAANLALKTLATGGVYIGGGIPPRILPFFIPQRFCSIFNRGVYKEMLSDIPINIILEPHTALLGAAAHGFSMLNK